MQPSFDDLLIVVAIAFAAPFVLGLFPSVRLPSPVLEIVAGIVVGPSVLNWAQNDETVAVIPVPPKARRVATGAGYVWVTSGRNDEEGIPHPGVLTKIDPGTNAIVATIALGFRPDGVAVSNDLVWVAIAPV